MPGASLVGVCAAWDHSHRNRHLALANCAAQLLLLSLVSGCAMLPRPPACTHAPDFFLRLLPPRAPPTTHRPTDTPSASTSTRPERTTANNTLVYVSAVLMKLQYQAAAKL